LPKASIVRRKRREEVELRGRAGQEDPLDNPEELVRRVYAFVAYRLGSGPDAEDVTSETFARALRYRDSYQRERGEPISWLIGIARRAIADSVARPREIPSAEIVAGASEPEDESVQRVDLQRSVEALGPRDRELIGLRYGADLTARQIGDLLGMRTNAVEVALFRALDRLRVLLADETAAPRGAAVEQRYPEDTP
jgi:RNA polymerase sigma-70 factor (ECF subfamily)